MGHVPQRINLKGFGIYDLLTEPEAGDDSSVATLVPRGDRYLAALDSIRSDQNVGVIAVDVEDQRFLRHEQCPAGTSYQPHARQHLRLEPRARVHYRTAELKCVGIRIKAGTDSVDHASEDDVGVRGRNRFADFVQHEPGRDRPHKCRP